MIVYREVNSEKEEQKLVDLIESKFSIRWNPDMKLPTKNIAYIGFCSENYYFHATSKENLLDKRPLCLADNDKEFLEAIDKYIREAKIYCIPQDMTTFLEELENKTPVLWQSGIKPTHATFQIEDEICLGLGRICHGEPIEKDKFNLVTPEYFIEHLAMLMPANKNAVVVNEATDDRWSKGKTCPVCGHHKVYIGLAGFECEKGCKRY